LKIEFIMIERSIESYRDDASRLMCVVVGESKDERPKIKEKSAG